MKLNRLELACRPPAKGWEHYPRELEVATAELWLEQRTILINGIGNENTYYVDQFGIEYFCKNYPQ